MNPASEIYQHIKTGGLYVVVTYAEYEADLVSIVIYKSLLDGRQWARHASEFYDPSRFRLLPRQALPLLQEAAKESA